MAVYRMYYPGVRVVRKVPRNPPFQGTEKVNYMHTANGPGDECGHTLGAAQGEPALPLAWHTPRAGDRLGACLMDP